MHYRRFRRHGDPLKVTRQLKGSVLPWLRERFDADDTDECLYLPGRVRQRRSTTIKVDGRKPLSAYALVCEWANGPRPDGMECAHSCGNGHLGCVNRRHLRWDTPIGNAADKVGHGTLKRGESHGLAVLTEDDVLEIRRLYVPRSPTFGRKPLAKMFGVTEANIKAVVARRTWTHI
jgi:hypothetical protein